MVRWIGVAAVVPVLVSGCSKDDARPQAQQSVVTVTAQPSQRAGSSQPARLGSDGIPEVDVVSDRDRCVADAGSVAQGSVRLMLLNLDDSFAGLALRPEDATSDEGDLYRLPNVGPGARGEMTVKLDAGRYTLVCVANRKRGDDLTQTLNVE